MKKIIYLFIALLCFSSIRAQSYILKKQRPNLECIHKHKKKLSRKVKRTDCLDVYEDLSFMFIYICEFKQNPTLDLFLDQKLIEEIFFLYPKRSSFPTNYTVIYNDQKSVVGYVEYLSFINCFYSKKSQLLYEYQALIEYNFDYSPDKIFQINASANGLYFSEENGNIMAPARADL